MFARTPGRRFWSALGGSVLAAWGPWWATWLWSVTALSCSHCHRVLGAIALFGPGALPGHLLARQFGLDDGSWIMPALCVSSAGAFVILLTALAVWLPRGRWAVWLTAALSQAALAPLVVAAVRM
ncbi:hypothetical protein [Alienimonas chondri]|uniref:Uncharacterized protein n=1 Tax=Alienimonas chondri TaxID=2681879 RepID=A0ABX1VHN8_9PLAN|nr:hypothetical protein [Alienimonas chondri]NNJ27005.1 hypothetical protein [Alienimonas chondri]